MTTLRGLFGETWYAIDLPGFAALAPWAAVVVVAGVVLVRRARRLQGPFALAAVMPLALAAYAFVCGPFNALFGFSRDSAGALFSGAFRVVAFSAACAGAGVVLGLVAFVDGLRAAPARDGARAATGLLALTLALGLGGLCRRSAHALGPPNMDLLQLFPQGRWRGQVGLTHHPSAFMSRPRHMVHFMGAFWAEPTPMQGPELSAVRADIAGCTARVRSDARGTLPVEVRATVGAYRLSRALPFEVEDDRGNPHWPLRVGARWSFRDRIRWTDNAARRRAIDDELEPRGVPALRLGQARVTVRVAGVTVSHGLRLWRLVIEDGRTPTEIPVYAMNGETWVAPWGEDSMNARAHVGPLLTTAPASADRPGLRACAIRSMPFTTCGDGSRAGLPAGPLSGPLLGGREVAPIFQSSDTIGEGARLEGRNGAWCLDRFTPGDGEVMPVAARAPVEPVVEGTAVTAAEALCEGG